MLFRSFVDAIGKARPIVLEPVVEIEILTPEPHMGDVAGDLAARRGQISGTGPARPGTVAVSGQVPLSGLDNYQARLKSITGGQGSYSIALSHYAPVPPTVQQQLAAAHKPAGDED